MTGKKAQNSPSNEPEGPFYTAKTTVNHDFGLFLLSKKAF